ncbi:glycosyltransferase family 4 protein [Streptomyces sp. NPDC059740]|uniref:glycosyltransferase family 4 protein n=1 Tax=Streptomyces sp. NPDC059740 TaxID=3346926 RepID=UPI00364FF8BD
MLSETRTHHDRLTVLHLTQPVAGGVAQVVTDLVRAQTAQGLHVHLACPAEGPLARAGAGAGARVTEWAARRELGAHVAGEVLRAARLVRRIKPDVVHAHSAKAGLAARLALRGTVPTVYQPHAWSFEAVQGGAARLARHWERLGARWAARILCVSEAERGAGERAGVGGAFRVIRNGVDLARYTAALPATGPRAADGAAERSAPDGPLAVCVGRLCRQKGQDVLLSAWPAVRAALPAARLVFVGDGPDERALRAQAAGDPSVTFAGASADPRTWYAAADLVVLPSRWEGMALAPLEAMACGRPVLVTDVGGARESLPPGHAGHCLVAPADPAALAGALRRLLPDAALRARLGATGAAHVQASFDVAHTAAAVLDLYHDLLRTPVPAGRERVTR